MLREIKLKDKEQWENLYRGYADFYKVEMNEKIEVWIEEIRGIHYYLDNNGNVYCPHDISKNVTKPKVIATYEKKGNIYTIPGLGIN